MPMHPQSPAARADARAPACAADRAARCSARCCCFRCSCWCRASRRSTPIGLIFKGAFGSSFAWQSTLLRAAPLMLTALCVALPAQVGLIVIGGEGALALGGLCAAIVPQMLPRGHALAHRHAVDGARRHGRGRRLDRRGRARCGNGAASTRRSAAC